MQHMKMFYGQVVLNNNEWNDVANSFAIIAETVDEAREAICEHFPDLVKFGGRVTLKASALHRMQNTIIDCKHISLDYRGYSDSYNFECEKK